MTFRTWLPLGLLLCSFSLPARGEAAETEMAFHYYTDTIYATGGIDADAASRLNEFVRSRGIAPGTVVAFSSNGGSVVGGMRLGRAIRGLRLKTNVFRYAGTATYRGEDGLAKPYTFDRNDAADCLSACVYAYLGGVQRYLYSNSRLGIHQFHFPTGTQAAGAEEAQVLSAAIVAYLSQMGVNPTLFSATALFDKNQMRYLSHHEAEDFGLVNNGVTRSVVRYQVSRGRPYPELIQESDDGVFKLGLLCNGDSLYVGASRELKRRSLLDDAKEEQFFMMDDQLMYQMDGEKDAFTHSLDATSLAKLFASRRIRVWVLSDGFGWNGGELLVDDWSQFRDYVNECSA